MDNLLKRHIQIHSTSMLLLRAISALKEYICELKEPYSSNKGSISDYMAIIDEEIYIAQSDLKYLQDKYDVLNLSLKN